MEALAGFKVPSIAKNKVKQALAKVADKLPEADLQSVFKFLADIDVGDKIMGREDDEEAGDESHMVESLKHASLSAAIYDQQWVNSRLLETGREVQKIITS